MLEVCLLGTGGMLPLTYTYLISLLVRSECSSLFIYCDEATHYS